MELEADLLNGDWLVVAFCQRWKQEFWKWEMGFSKLNLI